MTLFDDYLLLTLAVVMALGAVFVRDLFSGVLILAAYSFFWRFSGLVSVLLMWPLPKLLWVLACQLYFF